MMDFFFITIFGVKDKRDTIVIVISALFLFVFGIYDGILKSPTNKCEQKKY